MDELDYYEQRYNELYPNGVTQEETDEANAQMWKNCYPTQQMQREAEEQDKQSALHLS